MKKTKKKSYSVIMTVFVLAFVLFFMWCCFSEDTAQPPIEQPENEELEHPEPNEPEVEPNEQPNEQPSEQPSEQPVNDPENEQTPTQEENSKEESTENVPPPDPVTPDVPTTPTEQPNEKTYYFVLNTNTMKAHYESCRHVATISDHNYATTEKSPEELKSQGYTACKTCDPWAD